MKLLFDQNLSPRLVNCLSDLYPESNHLYPLGLDHVLDKEVWEYARREGFFIVTKDADFSDLCMLLGFPPKVIWIRRGNCKTSDIEALLRHHHSDIEALDKDAIMGVLTLF
jgi:predicted nuclease of predicted toxin-antitoxin system